MPGTQISNIILLCSAESHGHTYGFNLELFELVSVAESGWNTKGRNIILNLVKSNQETSYWPRLTKDKVKNAHIQADWGKWVDEDEESEAKPLHEDWNEDNMNNFNMGGQQNQGGDSDDDEEEEEEEHEPHHQGEHVHAEDCSHGVEPSKNADLGDLDAEEEA